MKFSELWLREWLNIKMDSDSFYRKMIMTGLEVTSITSVASAFNGIVIGEIVECRKNLNVNKFYIMKVNIGDKNPLNIVMINSLNCYQGMKVAVATPNAVLPENLKIKKTKSNSEFFKGKLCSFFELGMDEGNNDIIEFPNDAPIGMDIREYLKLDDNSIEINVNSNRSDCLSLIGIARDIAAFNRIKLNKPKIVPVIATIDDILSIHIHSPKACPRYLGRIIKNVNTRAPTPIWMKEKLRRSGIRSINTVINITNYIMLELGQPMYVFDKDQIEGGIVVRMAKEGEVILIPDGNKIKLNDDILVISDHNKILTVGGIFNNKYSGINEKTKSILLECAFFNPSIIEIFTRRYGLHTDASYRYERGVDPFIQYKAMERVTRLLISICGGEAGPVIEATSEINLPQRNIISLSRTNLDRVIGHHIADAQVSDILRRLNCKVIESWNEWKVIAPSWRFDIEIEEDLIEEIVRIYGYNNIPSRSIQESSIQVNSHYESNLFLKRVKIMLVDKGYQEVITYSFVDPKLQKLLYPEEEGLILPKPISSEMSVMRMSLWIGLLKTIIYNKNHQQNQLRVFEVGLCFIPDLQSNLGIRQELMIAGASIGNRYEDHWDLKKSNNKVDFYDIKGDLESILDLTGKLSEIEFRVESITALHPGQSASIYLYGERIGFIGVLHPEIGRKLDLNDRIILFEIEWNKILKWKYKIPKAQEISPFPENRRDITIIVDENLSAADILSACKKIGVKQVVNINLFDVYHGKGVQEGYKSFSIRLTFQDKSRTLEKEEVSAIVSKYIKILKERFHILLRD